MAEKCLKNWVKGTFLRYFSVVLSILIAVTSLGVGIMASSEAVYAEPEETTAETTTETENNTEEQAAAEEGSTGEFDKCQESLGSVAWLICPTTNTVAGAVDWLYGEIQELLVVNPVEATDGSPIYEIWKYCRGFTNIVFIIFLLIVIYSHLTGVGISNYELKKSLPKLIVAAVLVNLSFLICQLGVDLSNVIGNGLRGLFNGVEESVMMSMEVSEEAVIDMRLTYAHVYNAIAAGAVTAIGLSFESGSIWMLIPIVLAAVVAVATGLITIALRQAVVALLVMISPLAIAAMILPNTENLFKRWRKLFIQMLVFYPMFSLLFGASSLAGFAIMASAKDGFWLMLGMAVQVLPLFFSWKLMTMSGTFLGTVNAKMRGLVAGPLATNRAWADSHRQVMRARHLAGPAYTPSLALRQYLENRRIMREAELDQSKTTAKNRALAYRALKKYDKDGAPNWAAARDAEMAERNSRYAEILERDKNNANKGYSGVEKQPQNAALRARLAALDKANVKASDDLKMERARGAMIEYRNAEGFQKRITDAMNAHYDKEAIDAGDRRRKLHGVVNNENLERYETMKNIMEGNVIDTHFIGSDAAHTFNAQAQIVKGKFQNYFDLVAPTQDVVRRIEEMTKDAASSDYIDPIIAGLRTLNMRGDTDLVRQQITNMMNDKKVELGTYTSQSLASFLMFDVKGNDPFLRRLGKYLNLETAAMYNDKDIEELHKRRTRKDVSLYEYVNGEYIDEDEEGNVIYENGKPKIRKVKRGAAVLMKGTSFKDMERTAIADMIEAIRESSIDLETGEFDYEKFKKNEAGIWNAIMPNIISDQFAFLSGSEQIAALGKGITGVDSQKHGFDWAGIFGEEIASKLTPEQKKDYIEFLNKRTKSFLGGQVPAQIAKTKTDMLESIKNQYVLKDILDKHPELIDEIGALENKIEDDEYKKLEKEHMDDVKKEFVKSYKEDALKGFVKMHHKGYQGEAKDGLIQLLNPDELYAQFFPNGENGEKRDKKKRRKVEEEEDGKPAELDKATGSETGAVHNETSEAIKHIFNRYRGSRGGDVEGFWKEVKDVLSVSGEMQVESVIINDIEEALPQYTSVASLYAYIVNRLFGGF